MSSKRTSTFRAVDIFYIAMMILPILSAMILKVLTKPAGSGIEIAGAQIFFILPMPLQDFPITESQVNSLAVMITLFFLCLYFTHGIRAGVETKRQMAAEWIVQTVQSMVRTNMGADKYFGGFPPFIAAIMGLSALSSLITLVGLYPPTSDMNIVGGWAIIVFVLITYYKMKCGPVHYALSFCNPWPLTPINIISEVATPVSMALRHYGNVISGSVISVLIAAVLQGLSKMALGWLPGFLSDIPIFQVGIPAVFSLYFDIFSGCLQASIFAMLTMLYVSSGFAVDDWEALKAKKAAKAEK